MTLKMGEIQKKYDMLFNKFKEDSNEMINQSLELTFDSIYEASSEGYAFFEHKKTEALSIRRRLEKNYYDYIFSGLKHRLIELDFMTELNIFNSRRLIFTNQDCISLTQILLRDKIHLSIHMRSSHFNNALPTDLKFFANIPKMFVEFLDAEFFYISNNKNTDYLSTFSEEIDKLKNKKVQITITFGSLHI